MRVATAGTATATATATARTRGRIKKTEISMIPHEEETARVAADADA